MSQQRDFIFASLRRMHQVNDAPLTFSVMGNSMWPTLRSQDEAVVASSNDYFCGDILLFETGEQLIVHRLIAFSEAGHFITKGDNRRRVDATVSAENILGRVTAIKRNDKLIKLNPTRQRIFRHLLQNSWLLSRLSRRIFR